MATGLFDKLKMEATFWLGRRLPACDELARVMSESLERRLSARERMRLRLHFLICDYCRRYLGQLRTMRDTARERPEESLPDAALSADARERIRRALAEREE
jgi:hypothetical protein